LRKGDKVKKRGFNAFFLRGVRDRTRAIQPRKIDGYTRELDGEYRGPVLRKA
jgi:hypothetical protein